MSLRRLAQDVGVAHTTIAAYYEVLEDCLIAERVDPLTHGRSRRKLIRSSKHLIFDMGVRRACAREGTRPPRDAPGLLLEQWVGLELIRHIHLSTRPWSLKFWRDPDGPEVDWVLEKEGELVPIEVKWTDAPGRNHVRHLQVFLQEYKDARHGYLVCRAQRPAQACREHHRDSLEPDRGPGSGGKRAMSVHGSGLSSTATPAALVARRRGIN